MMPLIFLYFVFTVQTLTMLSLKHFFWFCCLFFAAPFNGLLLRLGDPLCLANSWEERRVANIRTERIVGGGQKVVKQDRGSIEVM